MIDINLLTIILLVSVSALYLLELVKGLLTLKALDPQLPEEFEDVFDQDKYAKSQAYTREGTRFSLISRTVHFVVFMGFWLLGGFGWWDQFVTGLELGGLWTGLAFIGGLSVANYLIGLPFAIYDTFSIEARYGFNRSTVGTFISDQLKAGLLGIVLGVPFLLLLLWIFRSVPNAWLWAWGATTVLSLAISYLAPSLILPLFNQFEPMPEGELKESIEDMAAKCDFPLTEVSIVDGSKRSSKSNAYFTGFGKRKRIALFDTLVENHGTEELVGVLAHEIGHFKLKHLVQRMLLGIIQSGVIFYLLGLFTQPAEVGGATDLLCASFGVTEASVYAGLVFFLILFKPVEALLSLFANAWSRKHEFEADAYAAKAQGTPLHLVKALKKLSADNLSNLTPHPFAVFLDYSHPPMVQRLAALRSLRLERGQGE